MDPLLQQLEAEHKADLESVKIVHVIAIVACIAPFALGLGFTLTTGEMTLAEYKQASSLAMRSYVVEGEVEGTGEAAYSALYINDVEMHLCRITDGQDSAIVWYDPNDFPDPPDEGDRVRIKLHIETVLTTGIGAKVSYRPYGIAERIEVTEPAIDNE